MIIDVKKTVLFAGLGLGTMGIAQEPTAPPTGQPPKAEAAKSVDQWIADLGSDSYRVRLEAEKALRAMGQKALPDLRKAADAAKDHEVQWRARRLARQIEAGNDQGLVHRPDRLPQDGGEGRDQVRPWMDGSGLPEHVRRQFEQMFEGMERDFGLDIPRARFFQDDFFRDLQDQLKAGTRSQGMSMQVGPDGAVRVEVKETNEKGEVETKVYEAPDMETFQSQHPGVLQKGGLWPGVRLWFDRGDRLQPLWRGLDGTSRVAPRSGVAPVPIDPLTPDVAAPQAPPPGKRLGVTIRPQVPAELRQYLELQDGVGLMIESVQSGTLAEALGLQRGDIVVEIAGLAIGGPEDVQKALGGVEVGKSVEVRFLRRGVEKTASATKKDALESADGSSPGDRLEPRKTKQGDQIR